MQTETVGVQSSVEGMYQIRFGTAYNIGAGVMIIETGRIMGGDSGYYYLGEIKIVNGRLEIVVEVIHHAGPKNLIIGVPLDRAVFRLNGARVENGDIRLQGTAEGFPHNPISVVANKLCDLP